MSARLWALSLALVVGSHLLAKPETRLVSARVGWINARIGWNAATRKAVTHAEMELTVDEEGYPVVGLDAVPLAVTWDGSAVHPSLLSRLSGPGNHRAFQVLTSPGQTHVLEVEYETPLTPVLNLPSHHPTKEVPLTLHFPDLGPSGHTVVSNGKTLVEEGGWTVQFPRSGGVVYLSVPDLSQPQNERVLKFFKWLIRLPFALLGGGGEGPPPLIHYNPNP